MNKGKIVIKNILSIITIILIAITSFSLTNVSKANTDNELEDNNTPTGDRTFIRLVHTDNNKFEVYLEVADTTVPNDNEAVNSSVSVRSFQIGLDIEIDLETEGSSINFDFDDELKDELSCETRKATINPTTNGKIGKRLNIYYVGNKDLNDARDNKDNIKNGIKIGTITFEGIKELETASIKPDSEFTKIGTNGFNLAKTEIKEEDGLYQIIIEPTTSEGEGNQGGSEGGSGEGSGDVEGEGSENGGSGNNQDTEGQDKTNTKNPSTGDMGIKVFIVLMIVSLLGIVFILKNKKTKQGK